MGSEWSETMDHETKLLLNLFVIYVLIRLYVTDRQIERYFATFDDEDQDR